MSKQLFKKKTHVAMAYCADSGAPCTKWIRGRDKRFCEGADTIKNTSAVSSF